MTEREAKRLQERKEQELSRELRYEIEAAFGTDKKIVNVLTGEVVYTPKSQCR